MIVMGVAPFHIRMEIIECAAVFILILNTLFGAFLSFAVDIHNSFGSLFNVRINENPETVSLVS